jgi:hypothetical protein
VGSLETHFWKTQKHRNPLGSIFSGYIFLNGNARAHYNSTQLAIDNSNYNKRFNSKCFWAGVII